MSHKKSRYGTNMSHKMDKRLQKSLASITQAGIDTLLENSTAGLAEIAKEAGIGRATMYRHFKTREALISHIAMQCMEELDNALIPTQHLIGRNAIEATFDVLASLADRYHFLIQLWHLVEPSEEFEALDLQQTKDLHGLINQAKDLGEIDKELPTEWIAALFDATLNATWTLAKTKTQSPIELAKYAKMSFFNGCIAKN